MRPPKSIYTLLTIAYVTLVSAYALSAQCPTGPGLFINEVYQDATSEVEWIEFVVVGDPAAPTDSINLEGWLFDDNNGEFTGSSSGDGFNQGTLGFGLEWDAVPPGAIILIYNENHRDPTLLPDDPFDGNGDGIYILPADHYSIFGCSNFPSPTSTSYLFCDGIGRTWDYIDLDPDGDVVQVRAPDKTLYHALAFGDFTTLPNMSCGAVVSSVSNFGANRTITFDCGDWTELGNYFSGSGNNRTPADVNDIFNLRTISKIRTGDFDYSNASINRT